MIEIYVTRVERWVAQRRQPGYEFEKGEFVSYDDIHLWREATGFNIHIPTYGPKSSIMKFPDEYEFGLFCLKHSIVSPPMKAAPNARL